MNNTRDTRHLILEAAYKSFGKYGFSGTSIKDIAMEAGIAPGSIYNYFSDKEDLFESAVRIGWEEFIEEFRKMGETEISIEKKFHNLVDTGFDLLKKAHPLLRGMFFGANQRKLIHENMERLLDHWEQIFIKSNPGKTPKIYTAEQRRIFIKYIIMGVLLAVSLGHPDTLENELEEIKNDMKFLIREEK